MANTWLEGTYSELYPAITLTARGMARLFRQFSFPGDVPSHVAPETPGSIHEGGELGYALSHAYGGAFDNPELLVACVIGDGEAETGALATSWHSNKFLEPAGDGAVLPILHLNCYKIANPTAWTASPETSSSGCWRAMGTSPTSWRATTRPPCTRSWLAPWTRSSATSIRSRTTPAVGERRAGVRAQ